VATAVLYDVVANVAAIPSSPANNDAVEVSDSTGIESFTPLNGVPAGYVGDSGLSVRIIYTTSGSTWNWIQYFPNDPETRYGDAISTNTADITTLQGDVTTAQSDITTLQGDVSTAQSDITTLQSDVLGLDSSKLAIAGGTMTGALGVAAGTASSPSLFISGDTNTGIYSPGADQVAISTNGTRRISIDNGGYVVVGDGTVSPAGVGAGPTLSITGDAPEITLRDSAAGTPYAWIATNDTGGLTLGADHGNTAAGSNIDFRVDGSERARIDSSGRLLVGTSSSAAIGSGAAASVQVATNASSIHQSWIDYSNGNNPSRIVLGKSISGTIGTAGAGIPANYILGELRFAGSNATDLPLAPRLRQRMMEGLGLLVTHQAASYSPPPPTERAARRSG
jgi:hypothetical protein